MTDDTPLSIGARRMTANRDITQRYLQDPDQPSWLIEGTGSVLALDVHTSESKTEVNHQYGSDVTLSKETWKMHVRAMGSNAPEFGFGGHDRLRAQNVTLIVSSKRDHDETTIDVALNVGVVDVREAHYFVSWASTPGLFGQEGVRRQEALSKSPKWLRDVVFAATGVALDGHF